jgi:hypothetical protein
MHAAALTLLGWRAAPSEEYETLTSDLGSKECLTLNQEWEKANDGWIEIPVESIKLNMYFLLASDLLTTASWCLPTPGTVGD